MLTDTNLWICPHCVVAFLCMYAQSGCHSRFFWRPESLCGWPGPIVIVSCLSCACVRSLHATADIFGALKACGDEPDPTAAAAVGLPEGVFSLSSCFFSCLWCASIALWCAYGVLMMCLWCDYDVLQSRFDVLMMCLWCDYDVIMMCLWCASIALWCAYDVIMMWLWCDYDVIMMWLWCASIALWCDYDVLMMCFNRVLIVSWICLAATTGLPEGVAGWLVGLARTVYMLRIWPYIWWFPCQNCRIYTVYIWYWPTLLISGGCLIATGESWTPHDKTSNNKTSIDICERK